MVNMTRQNCIVNMTRQKPLSKQKQMQRQHTETKQKNVQIPQYLDKRKNKVNIGYRKNPFIDKKKTCNVKTPDLIPQHIASSHNTLLHPTTHCFIP